MGIFAIPAFVTRTLILIFFVQLDISIIDLINRMVAEIFKSWMGRWIKFLMPLNYQGLGFLGKWGGSQVVGNNVLPCI